MLPFGNTPSMSYFVTGATGFIGRHLVQELLDNRAGEIYVLVRESSRGRMDALMRSWGNPSRVIPVVGDLRQPDLGVREQQRKKPRAEVARGARQANEDRATSKMWSASSMWRSV